jgi:uncharacterized protein
MKTDFPMQEKILQVFKNNEMPLYYIESGSRLWGIESPDSDFDVRGFHLPTRNTYFDFRSHRDLIEVMDGDFDCVSYTVDKMFGLLLKSNPTVFEWVRAESVYLNRFPQWQDFRVRMIENIDYKALFYHYLSLAKGHLHKMEEGNFTYKQVYYCLRGLFSAEISARHHIPELLMLRLFEQLETENEALRLAKSSLEKKKASQEKQLVEIKETEKILTIVRAYLRKLEGKEVSFPRSSQTLASLLTEYSVFLKEKFYL